jgi:ubiquitin-protein ligase
MKRHFPGFKYRFDGDGKPYWEGELKATSTGRGYRVRVIYPDSFPASLPQVYLLNEVNQGAYHHIMADGRLCFTVKCTAAKAITDEVVMSAAVLINDFDMWKETGRSHL